MKRNVFQKSDGGSNPCGSEHEQLVERLLDDPFKQEAVEWLKGGGVEDKRTVGRFETNRDSLKLVQEIYDLGVLEIFAVQIQPLRKTRGQHTGKLIVKLPTKPGARQQIFDWCRQQGESLGFSPDPDRGETHLFLLLD
jgi:hypothetical protein